jgi:hypothetical protein
MRMSDGPRNDHDEAVLPLRSLNWGIYFITCGWVFILGSLLAIVLIRGHANFRYVRAMSAHDIAESDEERKSALEEAVLWDQRRNRPFWQDIFERSVFQFICVPIGAWLIFLGKRLRSVTAAQLVEADERAPILYLRSFKDDFMAAEFGTEEAHLAKALNQLGPVIAIGMPGERLSKLGACRLYVSHERWQEVAQALMAASRMVLLRAGATPGLQWELRRVR